MGAVTWLTYKLTMAVIHTNAVATLLAILVAVIVYAVMLIILRILNEEEIKMLSGGNKLYGLLKKTRFYK